MSEPSPVVEVIWQTDVPTELRETVENCVQDYESVLLQVTNELQCRVDPPPPSLLLPDRPARKVVVSGIRVPAEITIIDPGGDAGITSGLREELGAAFLELALSVYFDRLAGAAAATMIRIQRSEKYPLPPGSGEEGLTRVLRQIVWDHVQPILKDLAKEGEMLVGQKPYTPIWERRQEDRGAMLVALIEYQR